MEEDLKIYKNDKCFFLNTPKLIYSSSNEINVETDEEELSNQSISSSSSSSSNSSSLSSSSTSVQPKKTE